MCTNFIPTPSDMLVQYGVERAPFDYKVEAYPGYDAPIIRHIVRKNEDHGSGRDCVPARFGLIPPNVAEDEIKSFARKYATSNARAETAGQRRSFRNAFKNRQFCLIPVDSFYEPCWETGKAVRWKIWLKDVKYFGIAGLWERWGKSEDEGEGSFYSFTMLTVNADDHRVMTNFHRHGEEKRMPVILHPDDYDRWLRATPEEAFRMCQQYPAELMDSAAAPAPRRSTKPLVPPSGITEED